VEASPLYSLVVVVVVVVVVGLGLRLVWRLASCRGGCSSWCSCAAPGGRWWRSLPDLRGGDWFLGAELVRSSSISAPRSPAAVRFVSSSYLCLLLWPAMVARGEEAVLVVRDLKLVSGGEMLLRPRAPLQWPSAGH
jgi:hypothetical protein